MKLSVKWVVLLFFVAGVGLSASLFVSNIIFGDLNQDEGWYLYAAKMVSQGQLPYRDFSFTQGPMLPVVYSLFYGLVDRFGVLGGRVLSALVGFLGCILASFLAGRMLPVKWKGLGAVVVFILLGLNVYHSYFSSIVKTYSLCGLLLTGGMLALCMATAGRVRIWLFGILSGVLLGVAAGVRLSAGGALAATGLYLMLRFRWCEWWRWISFGLGGVLGLCMVFLPFYLAGAEGLKFGLLEYHTLRSAGSLGQSLVFKMGFLSRVVQGYYFVTMLFAASVFLYLYKRPAKLETAKMKPFGVLLLWEIVGVVTLTHVLAPFPYDDYQVFVMPLFAVAVVVSLLIWLADGVALTGGRAIVILSIALVGSGAAAFSSPINQDWMVIGRDRIWWVMKDEPDLFKLRKVGKVLREVASEGDVLLTQDTYLAVEAGLNVPKGLEMGPFSYYPDFSDERLARMGGGLNKRAMLEVLGDSGAQWAAVSGYGLSIRCPEVEELTPDEQMELQQALHAKYDLLTTVPNFGQGHTRLRLYRSKELDQ